jgi:O-antigen/teichoic acid export membrane protein
MINSIASSLKRNSIIKNSSWALGAHFIQTIFISLFFVIIARVYSIEEFARYIIATALYQMISAFSTLGLSQWFVREIAHTTNREDLVARFFKMQIYFGLFFYAINLFIAFSLYDERIIHMLSLLLGANIIIDNLINAIKCLNIAEFNQKRTFQIVSIETLLKLLVACSLLLHSYSMVTLCLILLIIRIISLNLFLKLGSADLINIKSLFRYKISFVQLKELILLNWPFIIIGGASIVNWRIANLIISKTLTEIDVANYEISYKIFSIAQMLIVILSTSLFPVLIKLYAEGNQEKFQKFYRQVHLYYILFGFLSFTFIISFSDILIPALFGSTYIETSQYTRQMFFTMLVFPTALLHANVLIAMKLEKIDMWLNVILLTLNVGICVIGLNYFKSLAVVNVSIFASFFVFHVLQDILLISKKMSSVKSVFLFYVTTTFLTCCYIVLAERFSGPIIFLIFWISALLILLGLFYTRHKNQETLLLR